MIGRKDARAGGPGKIAAAWNRWKGGLFGCMFIMSKKATPSNLRTHVDLVVRVVQMLGFVLTSKYGEPWPSTLAPLELIFNVFNTTFVQRWYKYQLYLVLYYLAFAWVVLLVVLMAYGITGFIRNKFPTLLPLRVLQFIGNLSAGPLYIPLLQMLLSTFQCHSSSNIFWKDAGAECDSTSFTIQQAVSALLGFCLFVLAALFAAIFYESNSLSRFPDARAHGRADIIMLVAQAALVVVGQTFFDVISTWVIILTAAAAGILWLGAYFVFMPYYQHYMNVANIAGAAAFLWSVLCLTFNNYYPSTDAAITLYCGAPIAALAGLAIANYRATHILKTPASRLVNAFEVELKARYMLHEALWGHPLEKAGESVAVSGAARSPLAHKHGEKVEHSEDAVGEADLSDDVEDRAMQLRKLIPSDVLINVQQLYRQGASRFRASSFLHVFCARFYATYLGNRHMQFSHLLQAEKRSPPTDVLYLVFQARKLAEDTTGGGAGMSAMNRVTFEKYAADARRYVMLAAQKQMTFWAELLEPLPDLSRLHTLSTETNDAVVAAEKCFSELYAINPQSLAVIRLYAAFNTHVTCNLDKSMALTAEADRLEDLKSKDHSMEGATRLQFMAESTLDIMAENTAIITVGASTRNLGLISAANSSACKLFGYARVQLERRSALTMLPPPLDRYHEKSLKKYISTGEGTIVDYNRIIFGLHKSGAIVPLLSSIRDAPSDGGPPAFIWLLRELRTPSQYIILDDTHTVLAVTAGGSSILGVDQSAIASREIRIQDYLAEWNIPAVQEDLTSTQGAIIKFEARVAVAVVKTSDNDDGDTIDSDKAASDDDEEPAEVQREHGSSELEVPVATRTVLQETWVRAHLQHVELEDLEFWVLHCQRLTSMDAVTMQRIEERRAEMLIHEQPNQKRETIVVRSPDSTHPARKHSSASESVPRTLGDSMLAGHRTSEQVDVSRQSGSMLSITRPHNLEPQRIAATQNDSLPVVQLPRSAAQTSAPFANPDDSAPDKRRFGRQKSTRMVITSHPVDTPPLEERQDLLAMLKLPGTVDAPDSSQKPPSPVSSGEQQTALQLARPLAQSTRRISFTQPNPPSGLPRLRAPSEQEGIVVTAANADSPKVLGTPTASRSILKPTSSAATSNKTSSFRSKSGVDAAESRSSGGSSRGTTTSKSMVRLRRLLSDGSRGLLPGLWWLRVVGIAITLLAIVLAVAVAVIARQSFLQYLDYLGYVNLGAQRKKYKADVFFTLQDIVAHARGWVPLADDVLEERRANMVWNASPFSSVHQSMFNIAEETSMAEQYTRRYITLTQFDVAPNGVTGQYKILNLVEAGSAFVNAVLKFSESSITEFAELNNVVLNYLYYNFMRNGNGHEALQKTVALGYEAILNTRSSVYNTQIIVFVSMTVLICVIAGGVFFPILRQIESSADNIMKQFVLLPTPVRAHMHQQALGRVKTLRREFAQDDDAEMTSSGEEEDNATKDNFGITNDGEGTDDSEDHVDWDDLLATKSPKGGKRSRSGKELVTSADKRKRGTKQPYRKSSKSFLILVLRFIGPLVSLLLMFIIIFSVFSSTLNDAVQLTSIATAASYRASCSRQAMSYLRKLTAMTTDWKNRRNTFWIVMESSNCMLRNVRLMGFGDGTGITEKYVPYVPPIENGHPSVVSPEVADKIHKAMFGDACAYISEFRPSYNYSYCMSIDGGYLSNGLAAAAEAWFARAYNVADEQLRKIFEVGQLQAGHGWIIPQGSFAYNDTACTESGGCFLRKFAMPAAGAVEPGPLPDFTYNGEINSSLTPPPEGARPFFVGDLLNSPAMKWLEEADREYLTPGFFAISDLYVIEAQKAVDKFITFLTVFTPCYMVSFILIITFIFMPQVVRTNMDIHTKRTMLLYLPPQVVARIPSIKVMVDEILVTDNTHLGSKAHER